MASNMARQTSQLIPCAKLISSLSPAHPLKAKMLFICQAPASSKGKDLLPPLQNSEHHLPTLGSLSFQAKASTCPAMPCVLWSPGSSPFFLPPSFLCPHLLPFCPLLLLQPNWLPAIPENAKSTPLLEKLSIWTPTVNHLLSVLGSNTTFRLPGFWIQYSKNRPGSPKYAYVAYWKLVTLKYTLGDTRE